jgi:hypothetical protein
LHADQRSYQAERQQQNCDDRFSFHFASCSLS